MIYTATGHRPDKLGGDTTVIRWNLRVLARSFINRTPDVSEGISGMALGWDQAWAVALHDLSIPFIAAVPCDDQDRLWEVRQRKEYHRILGLAKEIIYINPGPYEAWKMQARNEWMVSRSEKIVALWNGTKGGTSSCLRHAKPGTWVNLWPEWQAMNGKGFILIPKQNN